jgi:23S rRNA (uracil1939-C5)-methyltransferase
LHLTIEKLVYGGDGLSRLPADAHGRGKALFLPFVLEGEKVEAALVEEKPGFSRASVEEILQPSPQRVEPSCPYFQRCGGCHYQHTGYGHQLEIKAAILKENLRRIAKLELDTEPIIHPSPPWNYRNRTRLKVQYAPQFAVGYYRFNSHEFLPVTECPISSPLINHAIAALRKWGGGEGNLLQEVEIFANAEDSRLLIELHSGREISKAAAGQLSNDLRSILPEVAGAAVFESVTAGRPGQHHEPKKLAFSGSTDLTYKVDEASYRVSVGAFFQVNRHMTAELARLVTQGYAGEAALDLYAGVGLFSTFLARSFAQVVAVEPSQTSHADLIHNSPDNVKAVRATSEQYLQQGGRKFDLIVVDPPRSGLGENVIRGLADLKPPRIAYVSCDPATLARDLRGLLSHGYRIEQSHLVDLFPQTYHLESVFHLARYKGALQKFRRRSMM